VPSLVTFGLVLPVGVSTVTLQFGVSLSTGPLKLVTTTRTTASR